jgi:ribose transport system substrate-binding protein
MKKLIAFAAIMMSAFALYARGNQDASGGANMIGFSVSTLNNPFFVTLVDGARSSASRLGVELVVISAGDSPAKQVSDVEDLINRGIRVIIINPVDSDAITQVAGYAVSRGVQIVAVDRSVNGVEVATTIASDNVAGARMATEHLLSLVGAGAAVAELQGIPGASATIDRGTGFHQIADAGLNVVSSQSANFNRAEGLTVTENILQGNPGIVGIFAHNDEMALGAIEAVSGRNVVVVGFDATDDALAAVAAGRMAATVAQQPELMGARAVEVARRIMGGETVERSIPVDVSLVTR